MDSWRTVSVEALVKTYGGRALSDDFTMELERGGLIHLDLYKRQGFEYESDASDLLSECHG